MAARPVRPTPLGDIDPFIPSAGRPVRVRARSMPTDTHFEPHHHEWGQLAYCSRGVIQMSTVAPDGQGEITYIVPPSRAVWIAPGAPHSVTVLEAADFGTLYVHDSVVPAPWHACRVIVVSTLLREIVPALDAAAHASPAVAMPARGPASAPGEREQWLTALALDEIWRADTQALGIPRPASAGGDKRLRALCDAVLREPERRATLAEWAQAVGASERTLARLFRDELSTTYQQWRQQVVLAHALPLLARGQSVAQVAGATGYASDSAFTAMFRAAMGQPPSAFQPRRAAT
jgi:AraC-like DNA-binding protein